MQPEGIERRRLRVYVAGPISKGDTVENVWNGIRVGRKLLQLGFAPYIPHLDAYLTLNAAANFAPDDDGPSAQWRMLLEWDLEWVFASEAILRLPGESRGADLECARAEAHGIPVFHDIAPLVTYAEGLGLTGVRK